MALVLTLRPGPSAAVVSPPRSAALPLPSISSLLPRAPVRQVGSQLRWCRRSAPATSSRCRIQSLLALPWPFFGCGRYRYEHVPQGHLDTPPSRYRTGQAALTIACGAVGPVPSFVQGVPPPPRLTGWWSSSDLRCRLLSLPARGPALRPRPLPRALPAVEPRACSHSSKQVRMGHPLQSCKQHRSGRGRPSHDGATCLLLSGRDVHQLFLEVPSQPMHATPASMMPTRTARAAWRCNGPYVRLAEP